MFHALILEKESFETFTTWFTMIAEDIFAHPDSTVEPPPLHLINTEEVAAYISEYLQLPILNQFSNDFEMGSVENKGLPCLMTQLLGKMDVYFRHAAEQLKEGVTWALSDWIDLEIHEEISSSDAQMITKVIISVAMIDVRTVSLQYTLLRPYQRRTKVHSDSLTLTLVQLFRFEINKGKDLEVGIADPLIARLSFSTHFSNENLLRDIKFLDEDDLIVITSPDGKSEMVLAYVRLRGRQWHRDAYHI